MNIPTNPSASFKKRNPQLYRDPRITEMSGEWSFKVGEPKKRIRQSTKPLLNKLEQEWFDYLAKNVGSSVQVFPQSIRFKLGNGIWYKPDFVAFTCSKPYAYEVKGDHAFRGGFENLKVAAHQYPNIRWLLVWKDNNGQWKEQEVLP